MTATTTPVGSSDPDALVVGSAGAGLSDGSQIDAATEVDIVTDGLAGLSQGLPAVGSEEGQEPSKDRRADGARVGGTAVDTDGTTHAEAVAFEPPADGPPADGPPADGPPVDGPAAGAQQPREVTAGALATNEELPTRLATYEANAEFLAAQREALELERSTYLDQASSLKAEAESLVEEMEPGDVQFDEESGEGGTVTVDRERDLLLSAQALAAVEEIELALRKIETGRYGICERCGELIIEARLEALPYARLCIDCKNGGLSRR